MFRHHNKEHGGRAQTLGSHAPAARAGVQYSTVQYSTAQYSTVQYSTVQYSTVQYSSWQLTFEGATSLKNCLYYFLLYSEYFKMEAETTCIYAKYGKCKKEDCNFHHPQEICCDKTCDVHLCVKKHPRHCRYFWGFNSCRNGKKKSLWSVSDIRLKCCK